MRKNTLLILRFIIFISIVVLVFNFITSHIRAESGDEAIFGTEEVIKNDQGEIIGWRCWKTPSNCVVVFGQ